MKVLALLQPWASAVVLPRENGPIQSIKGWETRSWNTPFRGRILIHASAAWRPDQRLLMFKWPFRDYLYMHKPLPLGCIIGSVEIVEVTTTDGWKVRAGESEYWYEEHAFGDYSSGRFAWRLDKPICFKTPIPYKGELGIKDFKLMSVRQTPGITDTPEVEAMIREWTADIVKKKQHKLF